MLSIENQLSSNLKLKPQQVEAVTALLAEGATIPFIARYRKDKTGGLDEVVIQQIKDQHAAITEFRERKAFIEKTIAEQGKMTDELQRKLDKAFLLTELEDLYLPYKPKRKTKAQTARENGLEPLALEILAQKVEDPADAAVKFINEKYTNVEEVLQGARDIIAELINENAELRNKLRKLFEEDSLVTSKLVAGKEAEAAKFRDYFDFSEPLKKIPSHRALAILRGFGEGFLRSSIEPEEEKAIDGIEKIYISGMGASADQLRKAARDAYKRLLQPSLETEMRTALKQRADEEAIQVFSDNLRQLLLSAPLGGKKILAIDPGYRTGCKVVCLDAQGTLLKTDLIYIHEEGKLVDAANRIRKDIATYGVEAIAIGDGTAGRETEQFIKKLDTGLSVFLVNEDGASVYSASEIAREEFPDQDITIRGAVSIGRRLMDPLAELVKIDPRSIGVGQYQHDVNPSRLKDKLDQTVVSCVNLVGVNLNTASRHLLSYVSGIGPGLAENIVKYRSESGGFKSREELKKVARLGGKAYEQCAGFLRIKASAQPLDESAVHPEAYPLVERMATDLGVDIRHLIGQEEKIKQIDPKKYVNDHFGELTIRDILSELKKPGLDPRSEVQQFEFANIFSIEDVNVGMVVPGSVTNITRFGAFVDIGVKQDGLVHISEIANHYISDPGEVLKLNQKVKVKVLEVDKERKRISLSIKQAEEGGPSVKKTATQQKLKPQPKPQGEKSMNDALSELKKKFGKN